MRTVLLIESHSDTRDLYAEYLSSLGFRVRATPGIRVGTAHAGELDAVIVGMDRHDVSERMAFVRALRSEPEGQNLAILGVGTGALPVDEITAFAAGCDVYLAKPCVPADLACELRHAILRRRRRRHTA